MVIENMLKKRSKVGGRICLALNSRFPLSPGSSHLPPNFYLTCPDQFKKREGGTSKHKKPLRYPTKSRRRKLANTIKRQSQWSRRSTLHFPQQQEEEQEEEAAHTGAGGRAGGAYIADTTCHSFRVSPSCNFHPENCLKQQQKKNI